MLAAIGDFLPIAMAVALSPFPIIAIILVLASPDGPRAGGFFALGWLLGLGALTHLLVFTASEIDAIALELGAGMQIAIGLGLLGAAYGKWRTRPRGGAVPRLPRWADRLERIKPARAFLVGAVLAAANPKNLALTFAAAASIAYHGLTGRRAALAALIFVLLGSTGTVGAVLLRRLGGAGAIRRLDALKRFMLRNNNVLMMVVFVLIGLTVLGDGLAALGN